MIDHDRIFALLLNDNVEGEIRTEEGTNIPLMDFLANEVPEVEAVTRIDNKNMMLANNEKAIHKTGVYADSGFFAVHIPDQSHGNIDRALANNHSVAVSTTLAHELFGETEAIGKTVLVDRNTEFTITSLFSPYPENSDFRYIHFVLPFNARPKDADDWVSYDLKLLDPSTRESVEKKIDQKIAQLLPQGEAKSLLFPVTDWRLHWSFENGNVSGGRITYVMIFSISGLFVLVMACINYMNISTARSTKRMREIGVRKMTGATQRNLVRQFMIESLIMTSAAALCSIGLAYLLLPFFNQLVGVHLILLFSDPWIIMGLASIVLLTSLLAGSYPAWILSSFKPITVLKNNLYPGMGGSSFRKVLVSMQFALSVVMIFCSLITWQQTDFLLKKDLGFDKHRIINIWLDEDLRPSFENLREQVQSHTAIESAALAGASPIEVNGYAQCNRVTAPLASPLLFYGANIDDHALKTLNFEFVSGRNFSKEHASDSLNFIVTQQAVDLLGFDDPIGQRISFDMFGYQEGEIVGVIKDFQHDDIHTAIKPVVFVFGKPAYLNNMFVKYKDGKMNEALMHIKSTFNQLQPGAPVDYSFLDSDFETQLHREKLLSNISITFTAIAISIAGLGLFGLVLFNCERRTKEIGIRKVLGASATQMSVMLCWDFMPQVFYSFLLAFPVGYFVMQKFLESYASHIAISFTSFLLVTAFMLLMVLITAFYQSIKAAKRNPVESLKTE